MREGGGRSGEERGRADQMSAPEDENEPNGQKKLYVYKNMPYEEENN